MLITDNRDGLMRGDRTHVAKVFATVAPVGPGAARHLRPLSRAAAPGRPASCPTPAVSSSSHFAYAGARGLAADGGLVERRPPRPPTSSASAVIGLELEGRVLNVFDEQVELEVDDRLILNRTTPNPDFGNPTEVSPPRSFVVSAILRF